MLVHSYYRTAIRHITRNRFFTGLNVVGLSIGIAFFLPIGAYGWCEWRVNRDLKNADRQYFLERDWKDPNMGLSFTTTGQLAPALRQNYPSLVANYYRWDGIECNISVGDKVFLDGVAVADSTLLYMYGFKLLQGDPHSALRDPFTIVLTASKARKYFGRTDVIGKNLTVAYFSGGKKDFRITAVMADPPPDLGTVAGLCACPGQPGRSYPAFVLSSRSGVDSLKSRSGMPREHTLLRKGLVSFQFGIAIVALAGALIISEQVQLFFSDQ